jgi:hypothetical protein
MPFPTPGIRRFALASRPHITQQFQKNMLQNEQDLTSEV